MKLFMLFVIFTQLACVSSNDDIDLECNVRLNPEDALLDDVIIAAKVWNEATGLVVCIDERGAPMSLVDQVSAENSCGLTKTDYEGNPEWVQIAREANKSRMSIILHEIGHSLARKLKGEMPHAKEGTADDPRLMSGRFNDIWYVDTISHDYVCENVHCSI